MEGRDILSVTRSIEREVCLERGEQILRRYYRFRSSRHYGGSAVADVIGCNLACAYCWFWKVNSKPWLGTLEPPMSVVKNLLSIARSRGYKVIRLSGGEPTLCFKHLIQVLDIFSSMRYADELFILESNGVLLGLYREFIDMLVGYKGFLVVRISLKGCTKEEFEVITGVDGSVYDYQINALRHLASSPLRFLIAIPMSFCTKGSFAKLLEQLSKILGELLVEVLEPEVVILYPSTIERLCRKGLRPWIAIDPSSKRRIREGELDELFRRGCSEAD